MKKNVIWWIGIENPIHNDKYGNFEYFEYSRKSWEYWCDKNDCLFVPFTKPVKSNMIDYRVNWQKIIFVFDELERRGIKYDQICLVDSTSIIRWDTPNFFNFTERKFVGWRDLDNLRWIKEGVDGYRDMFNIDLDITKYINSGFIIFNETHRDIINSFKDFYIKNKEIFKERQDIKVRKGNDQTPLNYWLQQNEVDIKIDLPTSYNLTHLHRKEMLTYNWQINEDKTPFFMKYGYNWRFTGIPKDQRSQIMKQVWDMVKHNYTNNVLDRVNHKDTHKNSTSRKFKEDLLKYFTKNKKHTLVEFGCCHGDTTRVLAEVFNKIYTSDIDSSNVGITKDKCKDVSNVDIQIKDINTEWDYEGVDVVYLDALHDFYGIQIGLNRIKKQYPNSLIIMDDYGHIMNTVKPNIDELISKNEIEVLEWIGEDKGFTASNGKTFIDKEGLIFKFK